MPSAARGEQTSTWSKWIRSAAGTWHAYSWRWEPGDTAPHRTLPACGADLPRHRDGRASGPPSGDPVCQACAVSVGFRRRPKQAAYMRRKLGQRVQDMGADIRLDMLSSSVAAIEARVALMEAALSASAPLGGSYVLGPPAVGEGGRPTRVVPLAELAAEWAELPAAGIGCVSPRSVVGPEEPEGES